MSDRYPFTINADQTEIHFSLNQNTTMPRLDFRDECLVSYFWSFHEGGFWTLRADASVHFFRQNNSDVFQKLATRAGGEVVTE
jgi:hypothetical protein